MDWLVRAALAALVPCLDGWCHTGFGVGLGLDAVSTTALAHRVLLHRDAVANWRNPYGQLHLSELSRSSARRVASGRSLCTAALASQLEGASGTVHVQRSERAKRTSGRLEGTPSPEMVCAEACCRQYAADLDLLCDHCGVGL